MTKGASQGLHLAWDRAVAEVTNPFAEARHQLPSAVSSLPRELLETNAVPLMVLTEELEASSMIEIGVIQAVTGLDVSDPKAIQDQRRILEDYQGRRLFDRDRTHCSNIDRIATQLRDPHHGRATPSGLAHVEEVIGPLRHADDFLLDEVESILGAAVTAIREIGNTDRLSDAEAVQQKFAKDMKSKISNIHSQLHVLHTLRGRLLDHMAAPER